MRGALERLGRLLEDEDWAVTVDETSLHAVKHPGVFYRSLSPVDRVTRGTLGCWSDGTAMHVRFRPDWPAALGDAGLLAFAFAITRGVAPGSRLADAGIAFLVIAAMLATLVPLVRFRFITVLARAVSSSNAAWENVRRRGGYWRFAWNAAGGVALGAWVVGRWVIPLSSTYGILSVRMATRIYRQQPVSAAGLMLLAALAVGGAIAVAMIGSRPDSRWTTCLVGLVACLFIGNEVGATHPGARLDARDVGLVGSTVFGFQLRIPDSMHVDSAAQHVFDGEPSRVRAHALAFSNSNKGQGSSWQRVLVTTGDLLPEEITELDWNELAAAMLEHTRDRAPGGEVVEHVVHWRADTAEYRLAVHDFARGEFVNWRCLASRAGRLHGRIVCVKTAAPTIEALAGVRESLVLRDRGAMHGAVGDR
jgi:hypothetical protein